MKILLVNPPVYDFSAYDFWLKPYGLLRIGGYLRSCAEVTLFDFMDRRSRFLSESQKITDRDTFGRGGYYWQPAQKPPEYKDVKGSYKRFGVPEGAFINVLQGDRFNAVFITSAMTYWYLGIKEVIQNVRKYQPHATIFLGGIYATLCAAHAEKLGADYVLSGNLTEEKNLSCVKDLFGADLNFAALPYWEGYSELPYGILKLNDGCPLNCSYCSVKQFYPKFCHRDLKNILEEYDFLLKKGAKNIAFYDDALLVDPKKVFFPFLEKAHAKEPNMLFHVPNAVHVNLITAEMSAKLKYFGFKKIFLGFESTSFRWQKETGGITGNKTDVENFKKAVFNLKNAGFSAKDLTAYLMVGHPQQLEQEIIDSVEFVASCGIRSMLAEFSPIPGTPDGEACADIVDLTEPLYHNSSVFPLFSLGQEKVQRIKDLVRERNAAL